MTECVAIVLVLFTLLFEFAHHKCGHMAEHSEDYHHARKEGPKRVAAYEVAASQVDSQSLFGLLFHRSTGEFTVLGFLAFLVWCFNQAEGFDKIYESSKDTQDWGFPGDGSSYLHMVEAVHMQLFIAMIFYFVLLGFSTYFASRHMQLWHDLSHEINVGFQDGSIQKGTLKQFAEGKSERVRGFVNLRQSFLSGLQSWRGRWPFFDTHLGQVVDHYAASSETSLVDLLETFFPLGQYISVNYRFILEDMVEVKPVTWCSILVLRSCAALLHSAKINFHMGWFTLLVGFFVLIGFMAWTTYRLRILHSGNFKNSAVMARPILHKLTPALTTCRVFQVCLFNMCFEFSQTIADKHWWETQWEVPLASSLFITFGMVFFGRALGFLLARLAVVTACGAFITEHNIMRVAVIVERHCEGHDDMRRNMGDDVKIVDDAAKELSKKIDSGDFAEKSDAKAQIVVETNI